MHSGDYNYSFLHTAKAQTANIIANNIGQKDVNHNIQNHRKSQNSDLQLFW